MKRLVNEFVGRMAFLLLATALHAQGQTSTWSGLSGSTAHWTDGANWVGGVAPSPGHDLVFPASGARRTNTNNFPALTQFNRLIFPDNVFYDLRGNSIRLTGFNDNPLALDKIIEFKTTATNFIAFNIQVDKTNGTAAINLTPSGVLNMTADFNLFNGRNLYFESGRTIMSGTINGNGGVRVHPLAHLQMNVIPSTNTYNGATAVSGLLEMFKDVSIPGDVDLSVPTFVPEPGELYWRGSDKIADTSNLRFYGDLRFFNSTMTDAIHHFRPHNLVFITEGGLIVNGDILPEPGVFSPGVPCFVTGTDAARIIFPSGDHAISQTNLVGGLTMNVRMTGPGNIAKTGTNVLYLTRSNDFSGVLTVLDGPVVISNNWALGATAANTVVGNGGSLVLTPAVTALREPLALQPGSTLTRSAGSWNPEIVGNISVTGPGLPATIAQDTDGVSLYFSNSISGFGTLDFRGQGQYVFRGPLANTFSGTMRVRDEAYVRLQKTGGALAVAGPLVIGDNLGLAERLDVFEDEQIADAATVTVNSDGLLAVYFTETVAALAGAGLVNINGFGGVLNVGYGDAPFTFDGAFDDAGPLGKIGAGTAVFAGNSSNYEGDTTVYDGTLDIRGNHRKSTVSVIPGARLTGGGSVSNLFVQNGGIYQPGRSKQDGLNEMTSGNLNLAAGAIFRVAIWGGGSDQHGRASVKGLVNLTNAVLDIQLLAPPPVGSEFVIIENDGADPVNGTFAGLPGGAFTGPGGLEWEIEYGNDVILRLLSQGLATLPPTLEGEDFRDILVEGGNGNAFAEPNECALLYIPIYNEDPATSGVAQVTLVSQHAGLVVHQPYSLYPEIPPGGSAYNVTPFQVSVPTNFLCGTNLPMTLVVKEGTNAAYALPIALPTGKPAAAPIQYDSAGPQAIPDEALLIDFVFVPSFTGHLAEVAVSLHVNHPALNELSVTLVGPGDLHIPLALSRPGTAYGTGCDQGNRTWFRANADAFIGDASAPYVGVFRPVGILPLARGMPPDQVANRWYLWVEDLASGTAGTLECWSLFLFPAECGDGGGICEACPEPIVDTVDLMEVPGAGRLARFDPEAGPTACGDEPAPDYYSAPGDFYYKTYTFHNQSATDTCVSVQLETLCTGSDGIISSAHLGGYNPALAWTNVLGYIGEDPGPNVAVRSYSFTAPGHAEITIVVSAIESYTGCGGFTLYVNGPDLCPAELFIRPAAEGKHRLDWSTGAAGYLLQENTGLMTTNWTFVPAVPVVSGDRFVVTNPPVNPRAFFRLLKP